MNKYIKKVLKKIIDQGFEAYIVGGYVRDFVLQKESFDIDICTNALPKDLHIIFGCKNDNYGSVSFNIRNLQFDITTYRKEISYSNRKPDEIEYISSLDDDLKRRDFTINTLCMDINGNIVDMYDALKDINEGIITSVGDVRDKFIEDPLRMLRAVRFATVLDFEISANVKEEIKSNVSLIKTLSKERIRLELNKMFLSSNYQKAIDLMNELGVLNVLEIKYREVKHSNDLLVMFSQIECNNIYFTKNELNNIECIRKIIEYGTIDEKILYKYGLYLSIAAGTILGFDTKYVNKIYKSLDISDVKPLQISSDEIMNILGIEPSKELGYIKDDIIDKILSKKLKNNKQLIKKYLESRK